MTVLNDGVDQRFEEYRRDHDLNKSRACKRLVDEGLRVKGYPRRLRERLFRGLAVFSLVVTVSWLGAAFSFGNVALYRAAGVMAVVALLSGFAAYVYREFEAPARSAWRYLVGGRA